MSKKYNMNQEILIIESGIAENRKEKFLISARAATQSQKNP